MKKLIFPIIFLILIHYSYSINYLKFELKNESNRYIDKIDALGFVCKTLDCDTSAGDPVIGVLWNGQIKSSSTYSIVLDYPSSSEAIANAKTYYTVFVNKNYKSRFKLSPVIQQLTGAGSSQSNPYFSTNGIIILEKAPSCSAPISLSVVNNIRENLPVSVTSGANLDATTKSAIGFSNPVWSSYIPNAAKQYFEAETTLRLRIYKYDSATSKNIGTPIHSENIVKRIYYDDTVNVAFTDWMPPEQTDQFTWYNVTVVSDVTDPKCSSKINQRASKLLRVWRDDPRNQCYSLIDSEGLVFSPVDFFNSKPEVGQEVTITLRKLSNYANDYEPWDPLFTLTPQDTNMNLRLKKQGSADTVITSVVPKNPNENFSLVSFKWTPESAGDFNIEITADAATCPVSSDISSDVEIMQLIVFEKPKYDLKFTVKSGGNAVSGANAMIVNPPSEKLTSNLGVATYNLPKGVYDYRIEKSPYTAG